ncbi:amino acid adenylation domain-containing protein [Aureisphaera galaxeae]|uniref:non-ribosomal peptide synthetase n=1 Tax=Aureisphaera galaxeae TaxID=1538023 RepID=UPI00234FD335|nr:amino acid adenylation domain-containing protein [Aureisphaera galaxeae]MDC8004730.1 amino acid adenylation domain-containing protein [Aureisphaera galaxeae]
MILLLEELKEQGVTVALQGNDLELSFDEDISEGLIHKIKENKEGIISFLQKYGANGQNGEQGIPNVGEQRDYELSNAQMRLWILSQDPESSKAYNLYNTVDLKGNYSKDHLEEAIQKVIERHEILRTVFIQNPQGEVRQRILPADSDLFAMNYLDYRNTEDAKKKAQTFVKNDRTTPFDLENGPLVKTTLIQLAEDHFAFYFNMHHIISDGWSMGVMEKDLMNYYKAIASRTEVSLPSLRVQYKDYAAWQKELQNDNRLSDSKTYWNERFKDNIPSLDVPSSKTRPARMTYNGQGLSTYIDKDTTTQLNAFAQEKRGSLFMGLLAAWKVLLYRYTGQTDMVIGTPVSGREHKELEDQIGFYVNTLAVRNTLDPSWSFERFFEAVKTNVLNDFGHQNYPYDQLIEDLQLQKDPSRNTLFDIMFALQNASATEGVTSSKSDYGISDMGQTQAKFDLTLYFIEIDGGINFQIIYNRDVYEKELIAQMMTHFKQLLKEVLVAPQQKIEAVNYLSYAEIAELTEIFNASDTEYPRDSNIVRVFQEQVAATPNNKALVSGDTAFTYKELDEVSNQLSRFLTQEYAISEEDFVGIKLERNPWHVVSILAILKAGSAFVPIDINYPQERIDYMERDSNCKVTIDTTVLQRFFDEGDELPSTAFETEVSPEALAYVMYTSGSTGTPKGAMIEQRSVVRLVKSTNFYQFNDSDVLLSSGSFSFDATTFEFFGPLLNGGTLVVTPMDSLLDVKQLGEEIRNNNVDVMWFTSGWLNQIVDADITVFRTLKTLLVGGDKLSPTHIQKLKTQYPGLVIINGYGPTENTTFSLTYEVDEVNGEIPIGFPISNSTAFVLDTNMKLVPKGVIGELYLGGDGLSRGYLNNPDLTQERFILHPFKEGERLYRTGDLAKWLSDGSIAFEGRADNQVKVSGHRIELGEIERALEEIPEVAQVCVLAIADEDGQKQLAAYIVADREMNSGDMRDYLSGVLPSYMLPSYFVQLDKMPLNSNGKTDRKALPKPENTDVLTGAAYVAPNTETEERMIDIWETILNRTQIGIKDDYFELGGNSLNALKIISRMNEEFEVKLSIKNLFSHTNVESLSAFIDFVIQQNKMKAAKASMVQIEI